LRFFIEAMPEIFKKHPDAELRIAGDGQELGGLKNVAVNFGIADRIRFLGAVPNETLPELYQTCDVLVFPSVVAEGGDREGFGLVLVEALGCECAVVATDLPATSDIIRDGETALIVRQRDPRQLGDRIVRLLNDQTLRQALGAKGRRHVLQRFDWTAIAARYVELIRSIAQKDKTFGRTA
jgi:glycosyltransferase involved in cell wall biosynthesis